MKIKCAPTLSIERIDDVCCIIIKYCTIRHETACCTRMSNPDRGETQRRFLLDDIGGAGYPDETQSEVFDISSQDHENDAICNASRKLGSETTPLRLVVPLEF